MSQPVSPLYHLAQHGVLDLRLVDRRFYTQINENFYRHAIQIPGGSVVEALRTWRIETKTGPENPLAEQLIKNPIVQRIVAQAIRFRFSDTVNKMCPK